MRAKTWQYGTRAYIISMGKVSVSLKPDKKSAQEWAETLRTYPDKFRDVELVRRPIGDWETVKE